eukprot:gene5004-6230_t
MNSYRYEILAITSLVLGTTISLALGYRNKDWETFPSTISTLNSNFANASGRVYFASILAAGICLMKSSTKKGHDFINSISCICYFCLIIIGIIPTALSESSDRQDRLVLIAIHCLASGVLFLISPTIKIIKIMIKWEREHDRVLLVRTLVLALTIIIFFGFIAMQIVIFTNQTEDLLPRVEQTIQPEYEITTWYEDGLLEFLVPSHIASFVLECFCLVFFFVDVLLQIHKSRKEEKETLKTKPQP